MTAKLTKILQLKSKRKQVEDYLQQFKAGSYSNKLKKHGK